ncbi:hypothetical protein M2390_003262 [Mycetocola sp. BIGb0189]|uniref:hypothetical protein n=1 Tax=Mycetocola sp. BIGb0189 TaxID=2940604 RepID=UPI0021672152|nr:hypothetical protein [Mycetocola sp. BIGb0189]MCS4278039.1 hypothetical protein [Mycetocola sp. BIGb0189]
MPETERLPIIYPDRDHTPFGIAHEFLAATAALDEHWHEDLSELPPEDPYTRSTYAVPVSGDHLARLKVAMTEGDTTP